MSRTRFQSSSAESSRPSFSLVVRARRVRMLTRSSSAGRDVELALEDVDELGPLPQRLVEVRERVQRLGVLAAEIEDGLPRLDGAVGLPELVGREARDLGADLGLGRVARGVLQLALVDGVELLPGALLLVDARQGRDGALVRLVELVEDAPVRPDGVRQVAEPRLVQLAEARVEVDELERVAPSP